jgi:hypothetical protein
MRTHTHTRIFSHIRYLHVFRQHPLCGSKEETEKLQMKQAPSLPVLKAAIDRFAHETGGAGIDGEGKTESEGGERSKRSSERVVCGKCVLTCLHRTSGESRANLTMGCAYRGNACNLASMRQNKMAKHRFWHSQARRMRRTMEDLKIKEQRMSTVFAKFDYSMRYLDRWERREAREYTRARG